MTLLLLLLTLSWTAPHDDGSIGGAVAAYDFRYAADSTLIASGVSIPTGVPKAPGTLETMSVTLPAGVWFLALRSQDDAGNWSPWSNVIRAQDVLPDTTPPAAITDLRVQEPVP